MRGEVRDEVGSELMVVEEGLMMLMLNRGEVGCLGMSGGEGGLSGGKWDECVVGEEYY